MVLAGNFAYRRRSLRLRELAVAGLIGIVSLSKSSKLDAPPYGFSLCLSWDIIEADTCPAKHKLKKAMRRSTCAPSYKNIWNEVSASV